MRESEKKTEDKNINFFLINDQRVTIQSEFHNNEYLHNKTGTKKKLNSCPYSRLKMASSEFESNLLIYRNLKP